MIGKETFAVIKALQKRGVYQKDIAVVFVKRKGARMLNEKGRDLMVG